ncbi:cGMP-specific 3',5'-cyclic phosphodiesterase isoform X1 [Gadus morhua]|uniref:cGMP-specific 3',5'-cyclic phosphodiesterase isoform X1 n=2 Tax=Gadus morhua TaxID=8049 RepID=UPI0011B5AEAE|nr:cGMP-specific 3',5'-cyclic phosphodiesterase isoform X1 [Gadus morhua]
MEDRYSAECDGTEAWLDDHLEFTHSYFIRKASREMVNSWFAERVHTIQPSKDTPPLQRAHHHHQHHSASTFSDHPPSSTNTNTTITINTTITTSTITPPALSFYDTRCPSPGPNASPAAPGTPTRKISASEFDRPLRPIVVKDSEGSLTFLCSSDRELGAMPTQTTTTTSVNEDAGSTSCRGEGLNSGGGGDVGSDRCRRLLELVREVSSHLDVTALCHKIFLHINELIAADRYSLFLVGEDSSNRKFLVSRLFDVAEGSTLEESSSSSIRLEWNKGIVGHVAATGQPLNIRNAYEDPRFNAEVDLITGYKTQTILCLPIKNHKEEVVGVAQAINKKCGEDKVFTEQDEKDFSSYLAFSGIVLHNAQLYETSQLENRRNQVLLDLASLIFEEQQSLEVLLRKIAGTILSFMQAQACTVFIADQDSMNTFSSVFHMEYEELSDGLDAPKRECDVSQINYMYAQYVQNTTMPLNITDVTKDLRFPWTSDKPDQPSNHIKSLLCTPIGNGKKDKVIGVCQLVNKMDEATGGVKAFNRNDEQFLEAFAIFCGLGIQNTQMYESVERAMAKQEVTLEVLSYHASAAEEETRLLQVTAAATVPSAQTLHIMDFSFSDFELSDMETTLATIRMFIDLNLVHNYQMKYTSLCHWVMSVKKNYRRNVVYHNWRHAFNTAQCMFAVLKSGRLQNNMRDLEMLALMIAALSHDLDHRGVNNSYIQRSSHPLAHLYCHSTMEHHHFDQCLMILNSPGNQILSGLSLEGYKATLKMIERAILATDLAVYMKRRGEFFELTKNSQFVWEDEDHRDLLRSMLMTACDISAITKPWPVQKRIAELVATEFFEQGDKEREELNIEPIDLMNREKRDKIPSMQVSFIDAICTQLYETLAGMSEHCSPLLDGCQQNRQRWKRLAEQCEKGGVNGLE